MRVVGIDQSYTGFGYSVDGVAKTKAFPPNKYTHPDERLWAVEKWLGDWLDAVVIQQDNRNLDLIAMEGYAPGSKFGREMAGELGWAVRRTCFARGFIPLVVPPTSLKKFVTGKGTAKKNEMLLGVYKKWQVEFSDDNKADAFSLEKFGEAYVAGRMHLGRGQARDLLQYEADAIEAVRRGK